MIRALCKYPHHEKDMSRQAERIKGGVCGSKILILPVNDPNTYDPGHLWQRRDGGNQVRSYKVKE